MVDSRNICDFITRLGVAPTPPIAWKRFNVAGAFFQLNLAPEELMRRLTTSFEWEDLIEAGAVTMTPENGPALSPLLAKPGTFLAFRTGPDSRPVDLLRASGRTLSGRWGLVAALDDQRMRALLERREEQLLIVPSLVDAAMLQSFGFPAVPVAGLHGLNGQTAEVLAKELRLQRRRTADTVPAGPSQPEFEESELADYSIAVVLANWSIAALDRSDVPTILKLWKRFQEIDKYFGIDMQEFSIWKSTDADLERFRFCIERGTRRHVERALVETLIVSCEPLDMTGLVPPIPQTFAEAVAAWAAFPDDSVSARFKSRAWKWVVNLLDQELIEPLRQQAREEADPSKRNQLMITAQVSAMLHLLLARLTTGFAKSNSAIGAVAPGGFPHGEFQQARAMLDQIQSLTKELHTGTPKRKAKPASRAKPSKTARFLPNSDSVLPNSPR
jgi:hypothetical protein